MLEIQANIWAIANQYNAIVITTNGCVKKNGEAVMGRGIAKEATERYPNIQKHLGYMLLQNGNHVNIFNLPEWPNPKNVFTLPVKPEFGLNGEMGWKAKADISLIERSIQELVTLINSLSYTNESGKTYSFFQRILMPRPGCGAGGLRWEDVKPVIEPYLDDRFTVATF
jgi:hypothetical protein